MKTQTRSWLIYQFKGLILITGISVILAVSTNSFRTDRMPWVEKRRLLKSGDRFPYVPLTAGGLLQYGDYVGFPKDKEILTIADIQADLLVIEVLNTFCFPCQSQVFILNKVYKMIENSPDLRGRIKIIGIALGNTKAALDDFIVDYGLAFPVVPDPDLRAEKVIGPDIHTPFSLFIRRDASGELGLVAATHDGVFESAEVLFRAMKTLLETQPGTVDLKALFHDTQGRVHSLNRK